VTAVCIAGVGAIGGWLAGAFADGGAEVSLLSRGERLAALRTDGVRVRRAGRETTYRLPAGDQPDDLPPPDLVVVAAKSHQIPAMAPVVAQLCGKATVIVPAVNGVPWWFFAVPGVPLSGVTLTSVDPDGVVARELPIARVVGCVVHASIASPEPGLIEVKGEDRLILGEPDGGSSSRVAMLCAALAGSRINPVASGSIRLDIWAKLWGNMTLNPLSVLTGAGSAAMLADAGLARLIRAMMEEMKAVGASIGLPLAMEVEERMAVTRRLGDFRTSMLQDALAGRTLETGPILSALVEIAGHVDVPVPFISAVDALMRVRAEAARLEP
jgi:2-dehydropantoate 2-reductase